MVPQLEGASEMPLDFALVFLGAAAAVDGTERLGGFILESRRPPPGRRWTDPSRRAAEDQPRKETPAGFEEIRRASG